MISVLNALIPDLVPDQRFRVSFGCVIRVIRLCHSSDSIVSFRLFDYVIEGSRATVKDSVSVDFISGE